MSSVSALHTRALWSVMFVAMTTQFPSGVSKVSDDDDDDDDACGCCTLTLHQVLIINQTDIKNKAPCFVPQ